MKEFDLRTAFLLHRAHSGLKVITNDDDETAFNVSTHLRTHLRTHVRTYVHGDERSLTSCYLHLPRNKKNC